MNDKIELTKSEFGQLFAAMEWWHACTSLLPGEEPIEGTIPPDREGCKHWLEATTAFKVADSAIKSAYDQQRVGEALGNPDALRATNRAALAQFVDDFCGTPPKWPLPWPQPTTPFSPDGLPALALLIAGSRFHAASEVLEGEALRGELSTAGDRLYEAGLERLSQG